MFSLDECYAYLEAYRRWSHGDHAALSRDFAVPYVNLRLRNKSSVSLRVRINNFSFDLVSPMSPCGDSPGWLLYRFDSVGRICRGLGVINSTPDDPSDFVLLGAGDSVLVELNTELLYSNDIESLTAGDYCVARQYYDDMGQFEDTTKWWGTVWSDEARFRVVDQRVAGNGDTATESPGRLDGSFLVTGINDVVFAGVTLVMLKSAGGKDLFVLSHESNNGESSPRNVLDTLQVDREYMLSLRKLDFAPSVDMRNHRISVFLVDDHVVWRDGRLLLDTVYVCDQLVGKYLVK